MAVRFLSTLPGVFWTYASMWLVGVVMVFAEVLSNLWSFGALHEFMIVMVRRYIKVVQRICLLANLPAMTPRDWRAFFVEVMPSTVTAVVGSKGPREALAQIRADRTLTGWTRHTTASVAAEHTEAALQWLQRPRLSLGYQDQLRLYGLARQATRGDCPQAHEAAGPAALARRRSWEARRGLPRERAAVELVRQLAVLDPGFCSAHPALAEALPPPAVPEANREVVGAPWLRLLCRLLENHLPADLDERMHRGKRWLLVATMALTVLAAALRRLRRTAQWRALTAAVGRRSMVRQIGAASACGYLLAITYGLPPAVHARLPHVLHALPDSLARAVEGSVGGPAPRLCRKAAQVLLPPVRGGLLREL